MSSYSRWRPHPWHGLSVGPDAPRVVHAYIEITPFDSVKYEVDKESGYLRVDRPQRYSSQVPTLYGFVPQTYCASRVQALSPTSSQGDGDSLDICVLAERPITRETTRPSSSGSETPSSSSTGLTRARAPGPSAN